jgi:hypothetical protein
MSVFRSARLYLWLCLFTAVLLGSCAGRLQAQENAARPLVRGGVDPEQRVTLSGNVHPQVARAQDLGPIADSFPADGLYLVLKRPPEREAALHQFLIDVQTPGSAEYRHWLTPKEFGERFGVADSDLAALQAWLESEGLTVEAVHPGRIALRFSGTAGAVRTALHSEIHRYATNSGVFYANATDSQIPVAFADLVTGISQMHSDHARPQVTVAGKTRYNARTHEAIAAWNDSAAAGTIYEMAPGDLAVQYGLASVFAGGTTGAGQTIGIISDSNVDLSLVQAYQTLFGLPAAVPTVVVDGDDPGMTKDATETYLDLEEANAAAPGANLMLYTSAGTVLGDPLLASAMRAVADNQVNILSVSYATCESALGISGNAAWASLWQEAVAQGISVFVAAGDAGSAGCDDPENASIAESGLAVNGLASTPYNVAVGGTDAYYSSYATGGSALAAQFATYWGTASSASPAVSLLQPFPEQEWNDAFGLNVMDGGINSPSTTVIWAGGGGVSSAAVVNATTGALTGYAKPTWQSGTGVPGDGLRDLPDVSLFAGDGANGVYTPICAMPGDCASTTGTVTVTSVGGTSVAAATMAGIQAVINAGTAPLHGRAGLTTAMYYALSTKYASATTKPINDVKTGTNQVPCYAGTSNCTLLSSGQTKGFYALTGYVTGTGFDRASGLGSVNAAAMLAEWAAITHKPTTTILNVSPLALAHGTSATMQVTVAPSSGTGTPTGTIALISSNPQAYSNGLAAVTLASGAGSKSISNLPGGTYQLMAEYGGDASFAPSISAPVTVTVTQEADALTASGWVLNPLDGGLYPMAPGMQIPYGSEVFLDAQPVGVHEASSALMQNAPATGAVAFTDHGSAATRTGTVALNAQGVAEWAPGAGTVGTHSISASYAGDASYAASSLSTPETYTVFKGTTTLYVTPMQTAVTAGGSVTVDVQLSSQYLPLIGTLPTGSLTVTLGGQSKTATWTSSGATGSAVEEAVVTFTSVPAGILPLSASYVGDTNWYGSSRVWGSIQSEGTKVLPTVTLTASATALTPGQNVTLEGTVTGPSGSPAAPSGSMLVTWAGGSSSYTGPLTATGSNSSAFTVTFPASMLSNGTNLLVGTFNGDSNYAAASSAPLTITLTASDFSLNTAAQEVALIYGKPVATPVRLTSINGFSTPVTVSCVASTGITCKPANASVTIGSSTTDSITLSVGAGAVTGTWPVEVIATGGGHTHSTQILVAATPPTAAPTFTPVAGTYLATQSVTLTDSTPGAVIYYTTNGTTPTTASTLYTAGISVAATETIEAIAVAPGYVTSSVSSAKYVITPPAATPVLSPAAGTYTTAQNVTITDSMVGATIYYTTNGSTPTTASTKYTAAIAISATETIKAVAIATGYSLSAQGSAAYTITPTTATPAISPASGTYTTAQSVTITDATAGAVIYYTINGTTPTTASAKYAAAITVSATETVKAIAIATGYVQSAVATAAYTITTAAVGPGGPHLPGPGSPLPTR